MERYLELLLKGFGGNLLITAATVCLLLVPGILLTFLAKKVPMIGKIFGWLSIPFECICPIVLIFLGHYLFQDLSKFLYNITHIRNVYPFVVVILCMTVAYMGYMPARFVPEYSFLKNVLYNGLGMISAVFKWSFCVFVIGCPDIVYYARSIMNATFQVDSWWVPFLASFVCLIILEIARRVIKQFMK